MKSGDFWQIWMQNTSLSLVETFFIVTVLPLLIFKGSKQYFRYFLMFTLKDFYSTAFSIFGNSTPVSMDFSTKFNFCSIHVCLNPRKSLKTKKNALNFKKRLIFNKNPDFLVIWNIYDVTVTSSFVRSCLKLIFKFVLRQYPPCKILLKSINIILKHVIWRFR